MRTFRQLEEGGTFRAADGGKPRAPANPRQSATYAREKAKAERNERAHETRGGRYDALRSAVAEPLPVMDELIGGIKATGNYIARAFQGDSAADAARDSEAVYLANKDAINEGRNRRQERYPVTTTAGGLLGGFAAAPVKGAKVIAPAVTEGNRVLSFIKNNVKAAAAGGLFAGAYGAADSEGMDRVGDGLKAVPGGLLAGSVLHGGMSASAPLVSGGVGVVRDVTRAVTRRPPPPGVRPVATPRQAELAAARVEEMASRKGLTPDAVRTMAADDFAGKPVTAAEIMGREGVSKLAATARRDGNTADDLEALLIQRQRGAPQRIMDDFSDDLGVMPEWAAGDIESMVEQGRRRAAPLYDRALGDDAPIWNDELAGLAQRPAVRRAFSVAEESARNAGRPTEALGMSFVDQPGAFDSSVASFGAPPTAPVRGPAKAPSRGKSLAKFIADGGGIRDTGGDVGAMAGQDWNKGKAFQRGLIGNGPDADEWALRAWEAGYFPQYRDRPTANQLLDALSDEMRGRPTYAREADPGAAQRFAAREASEEIAYYGGDPADLPTPEQYVGRAAPDMEPALEAQPTARSWDQVKRVLDSLVERDPVTGKVIGTGEVGIRNRDLATVATDLRRALAGDESRPGAIPGYREALAESGDYLKIQSAFERARGKLTQGKVADFAKLVASAKTPAEKRAIQAAIGADVLDLANRGQLKGGKFSVPGLPQKLEIAFGREGSQRFIAKMEAEARLARTGGRMMPGAGSPGDEFGAAGAESFGDAARIAGKFGRGQLMAGTLDALGTSVSRMLAYSRTAGVPIEVRDEFGRILQLNADEFADWLASRNATPKAQVRGYIPAGVAGGQLVGMASE